MSALRNTDIKRKIPELAASLPDWSVFVGLGNLTKLRHDARRGFFRANYESGLLLYALVRHFRPESILEIGTGRGFGALCLAMALEDSGGAGRVVTVDVKSYVERQDWPIDDGSGPRLARLSLKEVWEQHCLASLRGRIELIQGTSAAALETLRVRGFQADFVYIDGDHSYPCVHHDFYAALQLCRRPFWMLLDDYIPGSDQYAVRRLVDDELDEIFDLEAIYTDQRWHGEPQAELALRNAGYAQVLLDSGKCRKPLETALPERWIAARVRRYRRWGPLLAIVDTASRGLRRRLRAREAPRGRELP